MVGWVGDHPADRNYVGYGTHESLSLDGASRGARYAQQQDRSIWALNKIVLAPASLAGLWKVAAGGTDLAGTTVVCIVTGTGLKDPDAAIQYAKPPAVRPADVAAIERELGLA